MTVLASGLAACVPAQTATLDEFTAALSAQHSATETLSQWCIARAIGTPPEIRAVPMPGARAVPSKEVLVVLQVSSQAELGYRNVRLMCGDVVLSQAHNWYVPARLTAEMNQQLETTQVPFGRVVAPLGYTREQRPVRRGRTNFCPEGTVLSQEAVLKLADGTPISVVSECYTGAVLGSQ